MTVYFDKGHNLTPRPGPFRRDNMFLFNVDTFGPVLSGLRPLNTIARTELRGPMWLETAIKMAWLRHLNQTHPHLLSDLALVHLGWVHSFRERKKTEAQYTELWHRKLPSALSLLNGQLRPEWQSDPYLIVQLQGAEFTRTVSRELGLPAYHIWLQYAINGHNHRVLFYFDIPVEESAYFDMSVMARVQFRIKHTFDAQGLLMGLTRSWKILDDNRPDSKISYLPLGD